MTPLLSLLARPPLPAVRVPEHLIKGPVLVTGAGGSVGCALTQRLVAAGARHLIVVDRSEIALHSLLSRVAGRVAHTSITAALGDAGDPDLMDDLLRTHRPAVIFHMAAFKHVALLEEQPFAAAQNNAIATHGLLQLSERHEVGQVVLLSTDKAVAPASIMGASKRVAELIFLNARGTSSRLTTVRLTNVLGSSGSLVPVLRAQMRRGGPLTITHPDAARSFITRGEAAGLVLSAAAQPGGTDLYAADPGSPVRIVDLAIRLRARAGLETPLVFTGLRPGEKLTERLWADDAECFPTAAPPLLRIVEPHSWSGDLSPHLSALEEACRRRDLPALVRELGELVPDYQPSPTISRAVQARAVVA